MVIVRTVSIVQARERILRAVLPVFRENVADDLLGNGLLRRQKQVVHDHVVAVLHGQRIRDVLEPGDLFPRPRRPITTEALDKGPMFDHSPGARQFLPRA
jgi:hypothetical protein